MKFQPKTEKEIAEEGLLPAGEYPFEISQAEETVSKAGNEMIKLLVRVFREDGTFVLVNDYLLEAIAYKLLHICKATGLENAYNAGELKAEDFVGKTGMLKLKIRKDETGNYPDQNNIADYIVPKDGVAEIVPKGSNKAAEAGEILDDEIPF